MVFATNWNQNSKLAPLEEKQAPGLSESSGLVI
jgi:hypothetical protein